MKKTIIVLQGKSNSGKSETISLLLDKLKNDNPIIIRDKHNKNSKDFNYVIIKINKVLIGITTYGDYPEQIKKYLKILIQEKCKILICACHNTVNSLDAFVKLKGFERQDIFFIPKSISKPKAKKEMEFFNKKDAKILYKKIIDIIT
jgi:hypothetical protein